MFIDALFIIAEIHSQPTCPSIEMDEWIKTVHTEYNSARRRVAIYGSMDAPKVCCAKMFQKETDTI